MNSAGDLVTPGVQPIMVHRGHPVLLFVARRVVAAAATLVIVSILVFMGTEVLPGDAAGAVLGRSATPAQVEEMRELMGLDRPAHQRYLAWTGWGVSCRETLATPQRGSLRGACRRYGTRSRARSGTLSHWRVSLPL